MPDELDSDYFGQPHPAYEQEGGIPNAFGQYGISEIEVDTDVEGRKLVCFHTFMCETSLSIEGAERFVVLLQRMIGDAGGGGETLREACVRAQRQWEHRRDQETKTQRIRIFAMAIERGVTYRQLSAATGVSHGSLHALLEGHVARTRTVLHVLDQPYRRQP